ncbi:MAG: hypothetical protein NC314_10840 [Roseburia sp.]|nr:hypothetical protein [Roseburia sp.]
MQDPMRNAGLSSQFMKHEQDWEKENAAVSGKKKKAAYVAMGIAAVFILAMVVLFFVM